MMKLQIVFGHLGREYAEASWERAFAQGRQTSDTLSYDKIIIYEYPQIELEGNLKGIDIAFRYVYLFMMHESPVRLFITNTEATDFAISAMQRLTLRDAGAVTTVSGIKGKNMSYDTHPRLQAKVYCATSFEDLRNLLSVHFKHDKQPTFDSNLRLTVKATLGELHLESEYKGGFVLSDDPSRIVMLPE